jgi:hypothetical protein
MIFHSNISIDEYFVGRVFIPYPYKVVLICNNLIAFLSFTKGMCVALHLI